MKLTKQLRSEILDVYEAFLGSLFNVDIEIYGQVLDDNYRLIGTTDNEVFFNKKDAINFLKATGDQLAGNIERRKSKIKIETVDDLVLITEQFDAYVLIENDWSFYGKVRVSTLMQQKTSGWKIVQQHFSLPDTKAEEGQTVGLKKITKENLELRDAIKRRTIELEHKNRELEIEAALERVRARTMAMHQSKDLLDVIKVVTDQLLLLGIKFNTANFAKIYADGSWDLWLTTPEQKYPDLIHVPYFDHPVFNKILDNIAKGQDFFTDAYGKEEANEFFRHFFENTIAKNAPESRKQFVLNSKGFARSLFLMKDLWLAISNYEGVPYTAEEDAVFRRFSKVFEQAYTRFLDLQKAEAQAREAQIEAALERVRSRSMGMQKSDELAEVVAVLYKQFEELDFGLYQVLISIYDKKNNIIEWWSKGFSEIDLPQRNIIPIIDHPFSNDLFEKWENGVEYYPHILEGEMKKNWEEYLFTKTDLKNFPKEVKETMKSFDKVYLSDVFMKYGSLQAAGPAPLPDDKAAILKRFVKVLDHAYTRMKDLQTVELQAREAQIELGLERVRSRAMAMQTSEELNELIGTVFTELTKLDLVLTRCVIWIFDPTTNEPRWWMANSEDPSNPMNFLINYHEHPAYLTFIQEWKKQHVKFVYDLNGQDKISWDDILFNQTELKYLPDVVKNGMRAPGRVLLSCSFNNFGGINVASLEPLSDEHFDILLRFAKVFDLTYTRFNDLKQAEAQARESQIQLALERVRARTMAMQRSDELLGVVSTLYEQLNNLQFDSNACNIIIIDKESNNQRYWVSGFTQKLYPESYNVPYFKHPYIDDQLQAWKEGRNYIVIEYSGKMKQKFDKQFFSQTDFKNIPEEVQKIISALPSAKLSTAFFTYGALQIIGPHPLSEENAAILQRFAKVFDQTYTRFLDLQKAEAQAREAQIQLALERVRARTMAMQKSDELPEASYLIFEQFKELGVEADQFSIGIINEEEGVGEMYATIHGTKLLQLRKIRIDEPIAFGKCYKAWKAKEKTLKLEITGKDLETYNIYRNKIIGKKIFSEEIKPGDQWIIHCAFFSKGVLSFASSETVAEETVQLLERFTNVFDGTYTRFLDLKQAEAQAREAKIEAALERVRSRAMAMHSSQELKDVALELRNQMGTTAQSELEVCAIHLYEESPDHFEAWAAIRPPGQQGNIIPLQARFPKRGVKIVDEMMQAYHAGKKDYILINEGEKMLEWFDQLKEQVPEGYKMVLQSLNGIKPQDVRAYWSMADFQGGSLVMTTYIPPNDEARILLRRFANVFGLAYRRFVDLKQAEAQKREAQIELALERVRARTMAMHRSEELAETAQVLFQQLSELGGIPDRISIGIADEAKGVVNFWTTDQQGSHLDHSFSARLNERTTIAKTYKAWKEQKKSLVVDLHGEELNEWIQFAREEMGIVVKDDQIKDRRVHSLAFFSHGWILVSSHEPQSIETIQILERFASVFNLTYRRFLDLEKAEAQAREAQIETALEKVRARTMGMQHSDELKDAALLLFQQVQTFGVDQWACGYNIWEADGKTCMAWMSRQGVLQPPFKTHPAVDHCFQRFYDAKQRGESFYVEELGGDEIKIHYQRLFSLPEFKSAPQEFFDEFIAPKFQIFHIAYFDQGYLMFITYKPVPGMWDIFKRFTKVFEQTYTRFLDLQKAEAQANEARIEIALERIRARALAMHKSDELIEVAKVLWEQMTLLGQRELEASAVHLYEQDPDHIHSWRAVSIGPEANPELTYGHMAIPKNSCELVREWLDKFYRNSTEYTIELIGTKQEEWYDLLFKLAPDVANSMRQKDDIHEKRYYRFSKFSGGALLLISKQEPSEEVKYLQKRAAVVFDLAYRRFSDLQKAEAQAREAQIEAALEKVRSRSLAMHKSDELQEVVNTVFERLQDLNIEADSSNIAIFKEGTRDYDYWIASHFQKRAASFHMPYVDLSLTRDLIVARESGADFSSNSYSIEEKNQWFDYAFKQTDFKFLSEERKQFILNAPAIMVAIAFSKHTGVQVNRYSSKLLTDGEAEILKRFSKVFEQAYIRFLDLEKAESQAREAQIEASLERVRSKTMAMHNSNDVGETVAAMFAEFVNLGIHTNRCGILIFNNENSAEVWTAKSNAEGKATLIIGKLNLSVHNLLSSAYGAWNDKRSLHQYILHGDDMIGYYEAINRSAYYPVKFDLKALPEKEFHNDFFFPEGAVFSFTNDPVAEEHSKIFKRFAGVFGQTYRRYLDLQKAEAQAREAQIEASLERVRAKAMAMHSSKDLAETLNVFYRELKSLSVIPIRCGVALIDKETRMTELTTMNTTEQGDSIEIIGTIKMTGHPVLDGVFENWLMQKEYQAVLRGNQIKEYYQVLKPQISYLDYSHDEVQFGYYFMFKEGDVYAWTQKELTEDELNIYRRFTTVISLTYKRYKDLQQAEAQAREAQIEASLERVRAKAMAMHKSEDLHSAVATVFGELDKLKLGLIRCGIAILDKEKPRGDIWITIKSDKGSAVQVAGDEPLDIHPLLHGAYDAWLRQEDFSYVLKDEDLQNYYKTITKTNFQSTITSTFDTEKKDQQQFYFNAVFQDGSLFAFLDTAFTDEAKSVMKRFSNVFNLTYKRFLDLQKAEANAREAQIEAGLERVRARTMGMHNSEDVSTATATMFTELEKLGIENLRGGITIIKPDQTQEVWSITNLPDGRTIRAIGVFDMRVHPLWRALFTAKENKADYHYYWLAGKDKEDYITILNATPDYLTQPIKEIPDVHVQSYFFGEGGVWTNSLQPHSEEDKQVMKKFASVFSLTFRRYQDLKKAEAQAREATIEAALEKVRGKAMAMHNSNDLSVTTSLIIGELRKLGIKPIRCGVGIISKETHKAQLYTATSSADGDSLSVVGWVLLNGHPVLENIYEKFVEGKDYFPELTGDSMRSYYEQLLAGLSVPLPDFNAAQKHYGHFFAVSVGCLYTWSDTRYYDDEIKILKRFATIIDLTFRRYFELQKSEANAREAVKQAALDRVRADIASMRTVNDLDRITPLIWNELTTLDVTFIRCGVFIMDDSQQQTHTFLSTPDGKAIAAFHLPYDTPGNISKVIHNWRHKKIYIDHWGEEEFTQFADILMKEGSLTSREQYLKTIPKGGFYLHFLPFLQGMLYVGNTEQLNEEQIELIQHVADAFSTAYARYEDFNKLEAAKKQVENTLSDLKQAQTQLVQSEKMASLGELTAGIAHEIQNPLNFVNNFSDVSNELLEEMKNELEKGNKEDAIAIVEDVKQNLEKILHHGKRADAIVKGMLQHSRTSSGQKEMTDINVLADEYLRLAYHGLRAKDKSFNAKFETHFDDNIGKINVIPQEIGRVILNLINNAFYTVTEKKKHVANARPDDPVGRGYEPTVTVTTLKDNGHIEIKVEDNGNGIPQKNLDKIFQPFFTTKPTGQGTGLGLSLAYDIITKGHGGELKVETKEGEGSSFSIVLSL